MLIPNIIYALKNRGEKNLCTNRALNLTEQIGRYACIVLMWLPLLVWEFGFASVTRMLIYAIGNAVLLTAYLILFAVYFKKKTPGLAVVLAVLPACIFLLSGILLRHPLLAGFALLFAAGHICVTVKNTQALETEEKQTHKPE